MTYTYESSTRSILHTIRMLEIQAEDNKLSGAELAKFNEKHPRGADGRFGGGGKLIAKKVEEAADAAIDKVSDFRRDKGQSLMKVERDRAIAKAEVAKAVDTIAASPAKAKAAYDSIGPNVNSAIESIGKNFNNTNQAANKAVHDMMDGIGKGIRDNSTNVSDTIGKEMAAASLYLKQMQNNASGAIDSAKKGASDFGKGVKEKAGNFSEGVKEGFGGYVTPKNSSEQNMGRQVGKAALDTKNLSKDAAASIGRAATGLAAFMSPEHLAEVGKNLSKKAMDGAKAAPAKIKSMLDDLAKRAKDSIDKGTTAIKDFGTGIGQGFMEGANNKYLKERGLKIEVGDPENDSAAKAAGRKVGQFAGDRPMLSGAITGTAIRVAFGTAVPMSIPVTVGLGIGEDLAHPQSQIKKHVGDAYNMAKSKASEVGNKIKSLTSKEQTETKDKLDKSTAELAIATVAKDDKKIEEHKNTIADLASKIGDFGKQAASDPKQAAANLQKKLEPLIKQAQQNMKDMPLQQSFQVGQQIRDLMLKGDMLGITKGAVEAYQQLPIAKGNAEKAKVQASSFSPELLMASCIGTSVKVMASRL